MRRVTPLTRLCGLENEYVLRTSPARGMPHPTTRKVFRALSEVLQEHVRAARTPEVGAESWFLENGGRIYLERIVEDWGLVECATPECRGPVEAVLFQAAQELMLRDLVAPLETDLADTGWPCRVHFVRNAKDADGNLYGPQESYDADVASGPRLFFFRALLLPIPAVALVLLSVLLVVVATAAAARVTAGLGATVVDKLFRSGLRARLEARIEAWGAWLKRNARAVSVRLTKPVFGALIAATVPAERFMHRAAVRALLPFLASRPVVTGTGSLDENGAFHLSERAAFVDRVHMSLWFDLSSTIRQMRALDDDDRSPAPRASRGLTKTKALMNGGMQILELDFRTWRRLFRRRQRLELTSSDANRAQVAELLKVGTTMLVLDMHEAGVLDDAPVLRDPIAALKAVSADPTLTVQVPLVDGRALTALEIQRFYCERAARWIEEQPAVSLEAKRVVELWQSVLDGLARDPQSLVGVLDWPTKKMLLDTAGQGLGPDERKKIDIRYHELGAGYFERFVERGLARTVVDPGAVAEAVTTPPQDTPATVRGRLIREAKTLGTPLVDVDWEHVVLKDQHTGRKRFVVLRGGRD